MDIRMEKMLKKKFITLILLTHIFIANIWAAEILVDPSFIKLENVPLGKEVEITGVENYFLKIINRTSQINSFKVSIIPTKKYENYLFPGYTEIPDINWFLSTSAEVIVSSDTTIGLNNFSIKIPKKRKYYNQNWQCFVKIEKKHSFNHKDVGLEIIIPLWINTQSKKVLQNDKELR
jgi:hypothetical protein